MTETQVRLFASAQSWIEGEAVRQLYATSKLDGVRLAVGFPDLRPGKSSPVGAAFVIENLIYPHLIGGDIGCGMALFKTNLVRRDVKLDRWARLTFNLEHPCHNSITPSPRAPLVEFGLFTAHTKINELEAGTYVALLSHSGSRGTGAAVCDHYSKIAFSQFPDLPSELKRLAWLSLDSEEGQEYWNAMELMGRYAAANHWCIHRHIAERLGAQVLLDLENHHNFAWKEKHTAPASAWIFKTDISLSNNLVRLDWPGLPGQTYQVETESYLNGNGSAAEGTILQSRGHWFWTAAVSDDKAFYRVILVVP